MRILRFIGGLVVFFWLLGFAFHVFGGFIHLLLIVAAIVFIIDFITGRSKATNHK